MADRLIALPERALLDLIDLAERALDQLDGLQPNDAHNHALRGSLDQVRLSARQLV